MLSKNIIAIKSNYKIFFTFILITAIYPFSANADNKSINCDSVYVIQKGDNLRSIAQRAYGNHGLAQYLYDVNWKVLGDDPTALIVGSELSIPCLPASDTAPAPDETKTLTNDPGPSQAR